MSLLELLKKHTIVVADTGDIEAIAEHKPQDATTNPSLLLKAVENPQYRALVEDASVHAKAQSSDRTVRAAAFSDKLSVNFGREILKVIPGRVSTEVDASLSFDRDGTIEKARSLIGLYENDGVARERVLIKVASTWEGIQAAAALEKDSIHCNLTLLFSFAQAVACAQASVTLVSPFVGRIYDYYVKAGGGEAIAPEDDPGVASVERIYTYYKKFDYKTEIMGASFRNVEQIMPLCGIDLLTISPALLTELAEREGRLERRLDPAKARAADVEKLNLDEKTFRFMHNEDAMAVEKLSDGIRKFDADGRKLEQYARQLVEKGA